MSNWKPTKYAIKRKAEEQAYQKDGETKVPRLNCGVMVVMENTVTGEKFRKLTWNDSPIEYELHKILTKEEWDAKKAAKAQQAPAANATGGYNGNYPDISKPAGQPAPSLDNEFPEQDVPVINYPEDQYPEMGTIEA